MVVQIKPWWFMGAVNYMYAILYETSWRSNAHDVASVVLVLTSVPSI